MELERQLSLPEMPWSSMSLAVRHLEGESRTETLRSLQTAVTGCCQCFSSHVQPMSPDRARELLYDAHHAWNARDFDRLFQIYHPDLIYWNNFSGRDGDPLTIVGQKAMRAFLASFSDKEGLSVPESFVFRDGKGYAAIAFFVKDEQSGLTHASTFRQIVTYRDDRIVRLEEFHDAGSFSAFLDLLDASV